MYCTRQKVQKQPIKSGTNISCYMYQIDKTHLPVSLAHSLRVRYRFEPLNYRSILITKTPLNGPAIDKHFRGPTKRKGR